MDLEKRLFDTHETSDDSDDEEESSSAKGRKAISFGRAAVENQQPLPPESTDKKDSKKVESLLSFLSKDQDKNTQGTVEADREAEDSKDSAHEVSEAEAPIDGTLSEAEKEFVVKAKAAESRQELHERDPIEEPEAAAEDILLKDLYENMEQTGDIEAAARKTAEMAGIDLADVEEFAETEGLEEADGFDLPEDGELVFSRAADDAEGYDADHMEDGEPYDPDAFGAVPPAGSPAGSTPHAASPAGGGGHHGGGGPAVPPLGAGGHGGGPGAPGTFAGFGGIPTGPAFNMAPTSPVAAPRSLERRANRGEPAVFFVAGGIIGYLVGRRSGRIKTEKRLLPIQKKLEKQVEDLGWQIKAKESQIRKIATEKVRQEGAAAVEALVAKRAAKAETHKEVEAERKRETRKKAPEAHQLHGTKAPERIGQVLMSVAESGPTLLPVNERQTSYRTNKTEFNRSAEKPKLAINEKSVETLNRAELLQLSERIVVEGSSLRNIYETNLIGEKGLRRLVMEHLRGGDMAKALKGEIVEREIDFERDPVMRDIAPTGSNSGDGNSGGAASGQMALDQMVQQAAAKLPAASEEAAFYKARAAYEVDQSNKWKQRRQVIDISLAGLISTLLASVIYLFFTRG